MGLSGKFSNFNIPKNDILSQEDHVWLKEREKRYKRALYVQKAVYDIFLNEKKYESELPEIDGCSYFNTGNFNVPTNIDNIQDKYVEGIFSYFQTKYNVTLKNEFPKSDVYRETCRSRSNELVFNEIDYHVIVESITKQLGGVSFNDKATKEIKDALFDRCYNQYRDTWNLKVKGNKLSYSGGYISEFFGRYEYKDVTFMQNFLNAISMELFNKVETFEVAKNLYHSYDIRLEDSDFKNGMDIDLTIVKSFKFFKNGRLDITFCDSETCLNFARKWLNYQVA